MEKTKRTPKETALLVEQTIKEIRQNGRNGITDDLVSSICAKNKINEKHIKTVGGF